MLTLCTLVGCTASRPAPVTTLNTTPINKMPKGSVKGSNYVVKKGDTLYSIAFASGNDYRKLAKLNGLNKSNTIYPGQRIKLKESPKKSKGTKAAKASSKPQAKASSTSKKQQTVAQAQKTEIKPKVDSPKQPSYAGAGAVVSKSVPPTVPTRVAALPAKVSQWRWPVQGKVIRGFSSSQQGNKGLDIAAVEGTPVTSTAAGRVVYAGSALRGYGQLVIVKHSDDYLSAYAHNSRILVKEKQQVSAGQKIAEVGHSDADRDMLHFEIRYQGKSVDPKRYLPRR
ncbi:peptidoglycan DD-metalloendopeptidase family protein [Ferrimonas lipolytica]|uniref:peptidoglycan DD-metalloendopeptidase family protein n=1 Tax=Ferrimonas lipolytica TaxID=2724191 RepID=UPI001EEB58A6|nr:peptidoglycan DD-metalloendopeptidase family protein [Ferrimonas lipolytica]